LPVSWRVAAAASAIYADMKLTVEQRGELVCLAIWPDPMSPVRGIEPCRRAPTT